MVAVNYYNYDSCIATSSTGTIILYNSINENGSRVRMVAEVYDRGTVV